MPVLMLMLTLQPLQGAHRMRRCAVSIPAITSVVEGEDGTGCQITLLDGSLDQYVESFAEVMVALQQHGGSVRKIIDMPLPPEVGG